MKLIYYLSVGSFLISVTTAESDISIGDNIKRTPRALVLKPVIKEDDEGPFDFLAKWISRMINPSPKKPPSSHLSMLGSLRVPGINDPVFLENLSIPSRSPNRFVFRVMPETLKTPSFSGMSFTDQSNSFSPFFPITSTRLPITTNNFNKILSTASTWPRYPPSYFNSQHNNRPNDYFNNNYNNQPVNFYKEFLPHQPYKKPLTQYPLNPTSSPSEPFRPYVPQTSYGNYDNHNLISGGNNNFNYGSNYRPSLYPSPSYNPHDLHNYNHHFAISNQSKINNFISDANNNNNNNNNEELTDEMKETLETVDLNKVTPITTHTSVFLNNNDNITPTINPSTKTKITSSPASINDNEIYRSDRMIPTINPNYKDTRYWRPLKTTLTISSSSTLRPTSSSSITTSSSTNRYSARDIQEIPPPNLKNWKQDVYRENSTEIIYINDSNNNKEWIIADKSSDSRMDEKNQDGIILGQSDSQEYNGNKNQDHDPKLNVIRTLKKNINNSRGNSREWKPPTTMKTTTTTINNRRFISNNNNNNNNNNNYTISTIDNVMDLTANNNWKDDIKKNKRKIDRLKNSNNRRVRIVESVQSSVSMISSKNDDKKTILTH